MHANTPAPRARALLGAIAVAGTLFSNTLFAKDHEVTIALQVSTVGFDLARPADAQRIYVRLERVARQACGSGDRVGLAPVDDPQACYEGALAQAVRSVKAPLLTRIYLDNHTLQQAAAQGIHDPSQIAAK